MLSVNVVSQPGGLLVHNQGTVCPQAPRVWVPGFKHSPKALDQVLTY
jgi:hypothetical protein